MSIKKFFAGMAVLLSVSLFVIGCPTEAADGGKGDPGVAGSVSLPNGTSIDGLRDAIDEAVQTGRSITLDTVTLTATGTEVIDFKTAKVRIVGTLATSGAGTVVLNAANAEVTLGTNAAVALAVGHLLITKTEDIPEEAGHAGTVTPPSAAADLDSFVGDVTAVENYTLGDSATPFGPGSTLQVFVYGDLTIDDDSVAPTAGTVVAIGNVKLEANVGATVLASGGSASSVDVSAGVISIVGDATTVTVTLPTAITGYRFDLTDGKRLQVSGTTSIGADVRGNGTLELKADVTVANIAGQGRIDFNPASAATAFSAANHAVSAQSVKFTKGFTTPGTSASNTLTLKGAVSVPKDAVIGFGYANGVFTLEKGSTLWNTETTPLKLLTADKDVTVKGSATTTTLTVAAAGIEQDTTGSAAHTVTITGEATLHKGATYTVKSVASKKGTLTLDTGAILTLEADGTAPANLVLTGAIADTAAAALGGAGKVVAGKTEITGGNATGTWTAVGAATDVTISPDTIATGAGTALTADHANSLIEVKAGGTLTLTGAVALASSKGTVKLTGAADDGGAKLAGAGKVTLGNASITGGASGSWQAVGADTSIALTATAITGTGTTPVLKAADPTADTAVISLAKGNSNGDAAALAVTNATIDLSAKGAVEFPYVATTAATLVLKGGSTTLGALKLGAGEVTNTNAFLKDGSFTAAITGTGAVIKGASAEAAAVAGLISGGTTVETNDATITGQTSSNTVTVKAGATLVVAAVTS